MSEATTRGVRVNVEPTFVPERSDPRENTWFFAYTVTIVNEGAATVQLKSRHWVITDATGHVEHVRGPGVVGQQPVLAPGQKFEYTSACPLGTSLGSMHGTYQMVDAAGAEFEAEIAPFVLADPDTLN